MSELERKTPRAGVPPSEDSLPALIGRLGDELMVLLDSKLNLFTIELKEGLGSYISGAIGLGIVGLAAAVGLGCVSAAAAFIIAALILETTDLSAPAAYSAGLLLIGVLFLGGAIIFGRRAAKRLTTLGLSASRSVEELAKDREWLRPGNE